MAIGAFPLAKLGALLLKQISKPLANAVKNRAKTHPTFRTYVCMPPAQFYNWCEVQFKMWLLNLGKPVEVPKLNENQAIELGANILGEGIIFFIAAAILVAEYKRQLNKESIKEQNKIDELNLIKTTINDIYFENQKNSTEIRELTRHIYYLEKELKKYPPPPSSSSPTLPPSSPILSSEIQESIQKNIEKNKPFDLELEREKQQLKQEQMNSSLNPIKINNILHNDNNKTNSHYNNNKIKTNNSLLLSALNYIEKDIMLSNNENDEYNIGDHHPHHQYQYEEQTSIIFDSLDYLQSDVFNNDNENVIYILKNAPYASRFY